MKRLQWISVSNATDKTSDRQWEYDIRYLKLHKVSEFCLFDSRACQFCGFILYLPTRGASKGSKHGLVTDQDRDLCKFSVKYFHRRGHTSTNTVEAQLRGRRGRWFFPQFCIHLPMEPHKESRHWSRSAEELHIMLQ